MQFRQVPPCTTRKKQLNPTEAWSVFIGSASSSQRNLFGLNQKLAVTLEAGQVQAPMFWGVLSHVRVMCSYLDSCES